MTEVAITDQHLALEPAVVEYHIQLVSNGKASHEGYYLPGRISVDPSQSSDRILTLPKGLSSDDAPFAVATQNAYISPYTELYHYGYITAEFVTETKKFVYKATKDGYAKLAEIYMSKSAENAKNSTTPLRVCDFITDSGRMYTVYGDDVPGVPPVPEHLKP